MCCCVALVLPAQPQLLLLVRQPRVCSCGSAHSGMQTHTRWGVCPVHVTDRLAAVATVQVMSSELYSAAACRRSRTHLPHWAAVHHHAGDALRPGLVVVEGNG